MINTLLNDPHIEEKDLNHFFFNNQYPVIQLIVDQFIIPNVIQKLIHHNCISLQLSTQGQRVTSEKDLLLQNLDQLESQLLYSIHKASLNHGPKSGGWMMLPLREQDFMKKNLPGKVQLASLPFDYTDRNVSKLITYLLESR